MDMNELGRAIRLERKKRLLTQRELGDAVRLSEPTIRNIENGSKKASIKAKAAVATYLGVTFDAAGEVERAECPVEPSISDVLSDLNRLTDQAAGMIKEGVEFPEEIKQGFERLSATLSRLAGQADRPAFSPALPHGKINRKRKR